MEKNQHPFRIDPERTLQERMKSARKVTREQVFNPGRNEQTDAVKATTKK